MYETAPGLRGLNMLMVSRVSWLGDALVIGYVFSCRFMNLKISEEVEHENSIQILTFVRKKYMCGLCVECL